MTMTDERLAELDAVYTKPLHINFSPEWVKAIGDARRDIHNVYPDLRAHIDAQAATIARYKGALERIADGDGIGGADAELQCADIALAALGAA